VYTPHADLGKGAFRGACLSLRIIAPAGDAAITEKDTGVSHTGTHSGNDKRVM
jgi:hypothetical protein